MRKIIASGVLIVFSMLCLLPQVAIAENTISAQKATEIAKSIVNVPDNIEEFRSNYIEHKGRGTWELAWETEEGQISVNVDALSGEITQLYQNQNSTDKTTLLPTYDRTAAIKIANEFIAKAVPSKHNALQISDQNVNEIISRHNQNYTINYQRLVNNVPYLQNSAYVSISGHDGLITGYDLNWDYNLDFAPTSGIISSEKAENLLKNNALELKYYKPYDKEQVCLVYGVKHRNQAVDAHTGEYKELAFHYRIANDMAKESLGSAGGEMNLNPIELEEIDLIKDLLEKDVAVNIVSKHITIPPDYKLIHCNLYQDYSDKSKRSWSFDWQSASENNKGYISASVDANTGELLSFYKPDYSPERQNQKANYSYEQALKTASDFIAQIQPQKAKQIRLNKDRQDLLLKEIQLQHPDKSDLKEVSFEFTRLINDIPFHNDNFNLSIDLVTGEIISYRYNWSNLKFPKPDNIINIDNAFSNLSIENPISLDYIQESYNYNPTEQNKKVGLYYHFSKSDPNLVEAFKGSVLNSSGEVYQRKTLPTLTDISGHPSENDINTLLNLGIVSGNEGKFFPNNNITNAEFIKMLVMSIGAYPGEGKKIESLGDQWYSPYYQTAVNRKIISKEGLPTPNESLTRQNATYMMIKAMNLEHIAKLEGIYQVPASDGNTISKEDKGYTAITIKLGLFQLKENKFIPNDIVQRGESASTIVQLMKIYKR